METDTPLWVPPPVLRQLRLMEGAPSIYTQSDLGAARRLVFDDAMRDFFTDTWFRKWKHASCWSIWFDYAWHAATYEYDAGRDARRKHIETMKALRLHLQAAAQAMDAAQDAREDSPLGGPLEFADPFRLVARAAQDSTRGRVALRYEEVGAKVTKAVFPYDLRYFPNASDLLHTLSSLASTWLDGADANWSDPAEEAAMKSRQAMAVPQYVRWFDEQMSAYGWTLGEQLAFGACSIETPIFGKHYRIPDRLLAIQCAVALGLPYLMDGFNDRIRKAREPSTLSDSEI